MKKFRHLLYIYAAAGLLVSLHLQAEPIPVETAKYAEVALYPEFSAPAEVMTRNVSELSAETAARILSIDQMAGESVKKGDLLVRLDCRSAETRLRQTQAELKNTQARKVFAAKQYTRTKKLKQNVSEEEREQRRLDLDTLTADILGIEARIEQQQIDIENCQIKAPFDGIVIEHMTNEGEYAHIGTSIVKMVETSSPEVESNIRPTQAHSLEAANDVYFSENGKRYAVKLRALIPLISKRTRTRPARFRFVSESAFVGSNGRILWTSVHPYLPAKYIIRREGKLGVMMLDDGRARFQSLPGALEGQAAEFSMPLNSDIIVRGQQAVNNGTEVRVK